MRSSREGGKESFIGLLPFQETETCTASKQEYVVAVVSKVNLNLLILLSLLGLVRKQINILFLRSLSGKPFFQFSNFKEYAELLMAYNWRFN